MKCIRAKFSIVAPGINCTDYNKHQILQQIITMLLTISQNKSEKCVFGRRTM